jgi:hypothetical protein
MGDLFKRLKKCMKDDYGYNLKNEEIFRLYDEYQTKLTHDFSDAMNDKITIEFANKVFFLRLPNVSVKTKKQISSILSGEYEEADDYDQMNIANKLLVKEMGIDDKFEEITSIISIDSPFGFDKITGTGSIPYEHMSIKIRRGKEKIVFARIGRNFDDYIEHDKTFSYIFRLDKNKGWLCIVHDFNENFMTQTTRLILYLKNTSY